MYVEIDTHAAPTQYLARNSNGQPIMSWTKRVVGGISLSGLLLLAGCPSSQHRVPTPNTPSLGQQLQQQDDSLQDQRFRRLLDFESDSDLVFARGPGTRSLRNEGHTGGSSLYSDDASVDLRIGAVLFGAKPSDWTLLGCYVKPTSGMEIEIQAVEGGKVLTRASQLAVAGQWTFVSIDLTTADGQKIVASDALTLQLHATDVYRAPFDILVDDVILVDNSRTLLDTLKQGSSGWKISRRGHSTTIDAPGRFKIDLVAAAASQKGWVVREYGPMRIVLAGSGDVKEWVLYNDGRWVEDGRMSVKGASGEEAIASHKAPATVEVDEAAGRINRNTPGDADNDGYNEKRGAYQIVARQPRIAIGIKPGSVPAASPVLEIDSLPPGDVSVMVEGRLIETHDRLPDGRVLVNLPIRIDRPLTVSVKVTAR